MGIGSGIKNAIEDALYLVGIETTGKRERFLETIARGNMEAELYVLLSKPMPPEIIISRETLQGMSKRQAWRLYEKSCDRDLLRMRINELKKKGFGAGVPSRN